MASPPELLLVFPPFWDTASPYLSVPTLASWLRKKKINVETVDLNLRCTLNLLTEQTMEESLLSATEVLRHWPISRPEEEKQGFLDNLTLCKRVWGAAGKDLLAPFCAGATPPQTVDDYTAMRRKLGWAFTIASAPFYPMHLKPEGLVGTDSLSRLSTVCDIAENRSGLPGLRDLEEFAREHAQRGVPILGVSVAGPSQLVFALMLAKLFKVYAPETFVCVGGPQIPYIEDALRLYDRPFDYVDAFVSGEGELPLTDLCLSIRDKLDPAGVKGLLIRRCGTLLSTGTPARIEIAQLAPPDFSGFEPSRYIGNLGCLPLAFARGCSWSRCKFCTQHICFDGYRAMAPEQIEEHLVTITERYDVVALSVNDENLTPFRLRELARIFRSRCPNIRWQALARLEPSLSDAALAQELADSGCVMLSMGLESADQNVLDLNDKGISAAKVPEILCALHDAGIWLNIFLIFGLPGENPETAFGTIDFVSKHRQFLDSVSPTVFRVEKHSLIYEDPHYFGITAQTIPADHCDSEVPLTHTTSLNKSESMVCLELLINGLVGTPQCPIEQADLNGQFVLQMLESTGVGSLRREMQQRAIATRTATELLEQDGDRFRQWWDSMFEYQSHNRDGYFILSLPERGTFFTLTPNECMLLQLRALGLPINDIWSGFSSMLSSDEVTRAGMAWGITATVLLLLSSRILQESNSLGLQVFMLPLYESGADPTCLPD